MAQEILRQINFNGGELSPQAVGRRDLKAYASSLALCENMIPMAEGPIRRRPGTAHLSFVRDKLALVPVLSTHLSAPNGGTVAGLLDGTGFESTAALEDTDNYVICEIDFGTPQAVSMVDIIDFLVKSPTAGGGGGSAPLDPLPPAVPPQYPWSPPPGPLEVHQ